MGSFVENVNKMANLTPANVEDLSLIVQNIDAINQVAPVVDGLNDIIDNIIPNLAEILDADNNAIIATEQALLATTNGAAQVALATTQTVIATEQATTATIQAGIATTQANTATTKATEASTSASNALASEAMADKWANNQENIEVTIGKYSAYHWSQKAKDFASGSAITINYDNTASGLTATNIQIAIDELSAEKAELTALNGKQDTLVSGTNIKTINSTSLLGSGDISVVSLTDNETISGTKTFSSSPIVPIPTTGTEAANKDYVDSKPTLPIGAILNGYTIFNNCIVAFGGEFNRADYPKLWDYLQANPSLVKTQTQWQTEATANGGICGFFSNGNGTTTFRVPNLDNAFLRPDSRIVGSYQADALQGHKHQMARLVPMKVGYDSSFDHISKQASDDAEYFDFASQMNNEPVTDGTNGTPRTANETRPKNIAVLPLIVAK